MIPTALAMHAGGFGPGFGVFLLLVPVFWIAITTAIVLLATRRRRRAWVNGDVPWSSARGAETTLAERFAQGDIEEVEYRARLEVLRANRVSPGR